MFLGEASLPPGGDELLSAGDMSKAALMSVRLVCVATAAFK